MKPPILFTTYNRLEFTKRSLAALIESDCGEIHVFDNASTDGTQDYLEAFDDDSRVITHYNQMNVGVVGAMNNFITSVRPYFDVAGKVDNDTIVPKVWCEPLMAKMAASKIDVIQAKHPIMEATFPGANFNSWMLTKIQDEKDASLFYNSFVGGSGMLFNPKKIGTITPLEDKLAGWVYYQRTHPLLIKAFCTSVEIELLDMHKEGGTNYQDTQYYKGTGRL